MSRTSNIRPVLGHNFEGQPLRTVLGVEQELRRAVLNCLLWENEYYRSGQETADRIRNLAMQLPFETVAKLAIEARGPYKLRHVPLWLLVAVVDAGHKGAQVGDLIAQVIQRPDEMMEFVSLYWRAGKKPLTKQMKVGLAKAFSKFNEYSLAKFDKPGAISIRDVMFLCHVNPYNFERELLQKRVANKQMVTPDTWETALSAGEDKAATWVRLIGEQKLGPQAMLKNLRNMLQAGVGPDAIKQGLKNVKTERVLPYEFITAARHAPQFEPQLEELMFKCLEKNTIKGRTVLLIDGSASMNEQISKRPGLPGLSRRVATTVAQGITRFDAACGLAMLLREECADVRVFKFGNYLPVEVAPRRGFALRDALGIANSGTRLGAAVDWCNRNAPCDRLIVLTDEESQDPVAGPKGKGYMINVATYEHTVGYGPWVRVAGWSEAVVEFIKVVEAQ